MPKEQDSGMGMLPIWQASQARELKPLQPDETSYQPCCLLWEAAQQLSAFRYFATVTFAKVCRARTGKMSARAGDSRYNIMWAEYSQLTCGGRAYPIPYQLIPAGQTATIKAEVALRANGLDPGKVVFRTGAGATLVPTRDGNTVHLTLLAAKANEGYDLQALYPKADGSYELVGQLRVVSYTPRAVRVKLIPVGQTVSNASQLSTDLSALLKPFGLAVTLDMGAPLDDKSWDLDGNGQLAVDDKGFFNLLSDEQKALCAALRAAPGYDPSTFYLFVLPAQGGLQGDMPRAKQMGYLFGAPTARTVAHELMHGVFKLEHTFSSTYGVAQGSTSNLMDYVQGATLVKHQWDCLYSPGVVIGMFEKEEDGKYIDDNCFDDQNNYSKFKPVWESLKSDPYFMKVYNLVDKSTRITYCFSELKKGEYDEDEPPLGNTTHLAIDSDALRLRYINRKTGKQVNLEEYSELSPKVLHPSNEWRGMININMETLNEKTMFHELNHAAQFLLDKEKKVSYSDVQMEVETRLILYYSIFILTPDRIRSDSRLMESHLSKVCGQLYYSDLLPLTGRFVSALGADWAVPKGSNGFYTTEELHSIFYHWFKNDLISAAKKENDDKFDLLMKSYARHIKTNVLPGKKDAYKWDPNSYTPNYYLFNLIKK